MANFDRVLRLVGEFGLAQVLLYVFICLCGLPSGEQNLSSVFTGAFQAHWCQVDGLDKLEPLERRSLAVPRDSDGEPSLCRRYDFDFVNFTFGNLTEWEKTRENLTTQECRRWEFDTSEIFSTVSSQFDLVCDSAFVVSLITSIYMGGQLVGCLVSGILSDKFGRVKTVSVAAALQIVSALLAALAPNLVLHIIGRFMVAVTAATMFTTAFVIAMEVIGPMQRMHTGIFVQGWFALGFLLLSGLAYFVRNHQVLQLVLAAQPAFFVAYWCLYPESPRWLMSQGRFEEAERICLWMAKLNKRQLPSDFSVEALAMDDEELKETSDVNGSQCTQPQADRHQHSVESASIFDLVRWPKMLRRSLIVFFCWFATSITYYGLSLNPGELGGSIYLNTAISGFVELPAYAMCCLLLNRLGRVKMLAFTFVLGGAAAVAASLATIPWLRITLGMLSKFACSASFAIIYVYTAEVFPTVILNAGVGVSSVNARVGALLAPQLALLSTLWRPLPFVLIGCLSIAAGALAFLLPETLNQPLPETMQDGEDFGGSGSSNAVSPLKTKIST